MIIFKLGIYFSVDYLVRVSCKHTNITGIMPMIWGPESSQYLSSSPHSLLIILTTGMTFRLRRFGKSVFIFSTLKKADHPLPVYQTRCIFPFLPRWSTHPGWKVQAMQTQKLFGKASLTVALSHQIPSWFTISVSLTQEPEGQWNINGYIGRNGGPDLIS